ncbi:recombinase RecT [Clostridium sp. A1-XYC3]|uniref:Recombinase RecT n=1 Tax=Clostridium tanneri TaxID=3037988 RepID=A0ABU4JVY8_9CLOT|nr:recombinase RecT [Clostridium sp. A1-XYC3]MDW8802325.1 recombinase RecT [Clostridium sp. A1-XYC3]
MGNKIVELPQQNNVLAYDSRQIELIRNTVAKGATEDELSIFLYLSKQYNLDPFKREIWFTKYGNQTNIMTSRDGYLKFAQTSAEFEGLISFVVQEGDVFEIDAAEYKITHRFGTKRGRIIGAWARCDRKGKKPFISYVDFGEYNQNNMIWKKYPSAMIQKVAEVFVLKRAFGINGLVTREEIGDEIRDETFTRKYKEEIPKARGMKREQKAEIWELAKNKGMEVDELKQYTMKELGIPLSNLNDEQADALIETLSKGKKELNENMEDKNSEENEEIKELALSKKE